VFKTASPDDVAAAVREAFTHAVDVVPRGPTPAAPKPDETLAGLTRRETEVLGLVAQGLTNAKMAKSLRVTEQTVKFHLSKIYRKLNVGNRTEASRWAHARGLVRVKPPASDAERVSREG